MRKKDKRILLSWYYYKDRIDSWLWLLLALHFFLLLEDRASDSPLWEREVFISAVYTPFVTGANQNPALTSKNPGRKLPGKLREREGSKSIYISHKFQLSFIIWSWDYLIIFWLFLFKDKKPLDLGFATGSSNHSFYGLGFGNPKRLFQERVNWIYWVSFSEAWTSL